MLFLVATILLGSFVVVRLSYAAWSEPSVAPPGNNTNPPLDTSSTSQNKTGALTVGSTTNFTATGMYAPIYYDSDNTNYYVKPYNTAGPSAIFSNAVGIGTTNPGALFNVNGQSLFGGTAMSYADSNDAIYVQGPTNNYSQIHFYTNGGGTTVNGYLSTNSSAGGVGPGAMNLWTLNSTPVNIGTNDNIRVTVTGSGNVGIGTSSPTTAGLVVATNVSGVALDVDNNRIANLANPVNAQDAATKSYVDAASSGGSDAANSMTANSGMYENKIIAMNPPAAYTEICFKNGATYYDIHAAGAATGGGNCSVGDTGYIIEDAVRSAAYFTTAKQVCTENNMRLPEPYEWQLACMNASTWGLSSMGTQWEWASNFTLPMYNGSYGGVGAAVFGGSGCGYAGWYWLGGNGGGQDSNFYRCAR